MIYSKSTQYAIRALMRLAVQPSGQLCRLEEIARKEEIPRHFLAKILQRLVHKRLVRSVKGIRGGFALARPAEKITLYLIADAMEDLSVSIDDCIFGNKICGEDQPCPLHEPWAKLRDQQLQFLQSIRIADLVKQGV
jgi:Rrf2 family transcriptional regulator, iron-sulfur cluster assembly transcription factor